MKTKISLLILITAVISSSFVSIKKLEEKAVKLTEKSAQKTYQEPVGGFVSEDKP